MHRAESFAWLLEQRAESFDALVTDPPYSSGGFTRGDRCLSSAKQKYLQSGSRQRVKLPTFDGDNRDQRGFLAWCSLWLTSAYRLVRVGSPAVVFCDWRQIPITTDAFQAGGFVWRGVAVWTKKGASRPQMGRYRSDSEFVVWGSRGPLPARLDVGVLEGTFSFPPVHFSRRKHITEKPADLMERIVRIAPPGGRVLDPFAGSGATGIGCLRTGRRFVGVERERGTFEATCDALADEERRLARARRAAA